MYQLDTHKVIHVERSIFWGAITLVIMTEKLRMNMCLILNGYRERAA